MLYKYKYKSVVIPPGSKMIFLQIGLESVKDKLVSFLKPDS